MSSRSMRYLDLVLSPGAGGPAGVDERAQILRDLRRQAEDDGAQIDRALIEEIARLHKGLADATEARSAMASLLERLTLPPWHEAIFLETRAGGGGPPQGAVKPGAVTPGSSLGPAPAGQPANGSVPAGGGGSGSAAPRRATVFYGNARRVVGISEDVNPSSLRAGDTVLLNESLNLIVGTDLAPTWGEVAVWDRHTSDGRMVLKDRDEEIIVTAAEPLRHCGLRQGDLVRWIRPAFMAYEKVDRSEGRKFFIEESPMESFDRIGGLAAQIAEIQVILTLQVEYPWIFSKYQLVRPGSILLAGPPGCGKTKLARALSAFLGKLSRSGRSRFIAVKPAELHSCWYSVTESNYRELFRVARQAGAEEPDVPVVLFLDEVDAIGSVAGRHRNQVDDRVVSALAAELDGLEARGNILVVSASNNAAAIEPKLLRAGRLADVVLTIPRPNRRAAAEILSKYLVSGLPYALDGHGADMEATRRDIIESTVSRIYSPNGDCDLATLLFRDGSRRVVRGADLVSGATLREIARKASERAARREAALGNGGIRLADVLDATTEALEASARSLTAENCRRHLENLPEHVDVVGVTPVARKVTRPIRLLNTVPA